MPWKQQSVRSSERERLGAWEPLAAHNTSAHVSAADDVTPNSIGARRTRCYQAVQCRRGDSSIERGAEEIIGAFAHS